MSKQCYVVTNPENGWDCVNGVYLANSEEEVAKKYIEERGINIGDFTPEEWMEENNKIIHLSRLTEV